MYLNHLDYEQDMLQHVLCYTVTEFLGCAKYRVTEYGTFDTALRDFNEWKDADPSRRLLIYAVCQPPNRPLTVSLPIPQDWYGKLSS